jgi:hypothetical protein
MGEHQRKGDSEGRFGTGETRGRLVPVLDEKRIAQAERSPKQAIGAQSLSNKSFLELAGSGAGSGSGLFALELAAWPLASTPSPTTRKQWLEPLNPNYTISPMMPTEERRSLDKS